LPKADLDEFFFMLLSDLLEVIKRTLFLNESFSIIHGKNMLSVALRKFRSDPNPIDGTVRT
jgi:hypothetical protein